MTQQAQPFLITGMPFCETAWLSAFLNMGKTSICYLDPLGRLTSLEELKELYRSNFYEFIGVADGGLAFFLDWMIDHVRPKIVILDRSVEEADRDMAKQGIPPTNYNELMREELLRFRGDPNVLWVPNDMLHEKRVAQKVFWHLLPGQAFDEVRFAEFDRYKIELDIVNTARNNIERKKIFGNLLKDVIPRVHMKGNGHAPAAAA